MADGSITWGDYDYALRASLFLFVVSIRKPVIRDLFSVNSMIVEF